LTFVPEELREQRVKCFNNCAAAELKLQRVEEALAACEAALSISPDNGRALLRRGQLLAQQGRDAEAALVLRRALELDPANEVVHAELSRLVKRRSAPGPAAPQEPPPGPTPPSSGCAAAPSDRAARGRVGAGARSTPWRSRLPPRRDPAPPSAEGAA
uniref:Uncharacterized protein n=1 Tax=Melopsittacus undulatus TaxID=13146 RepID=A0A8V5HDT4_MELUD